MKFPFAFYFNRKQKLFFLAILVLFIIFLLLDAFHTDVFHSWIKPLLSPYLHLAEFIANKGFHYANLPLNIHEHVFRFQGEYQSHLISREDILGQWMDYLLFKKWTLFLLFIFIAFSTTLKKKLIFSFLLIPIHFFSIVSSLILLGAYSLKLIETNQEMVEPPVFIGQLLMVTLLYWWIRNNFEIIPKVLSKLGLEFALTKRRINEFFFFLFAFTIVDSLLLPYMGFQNYISGIVSLSSHLLNLFGYEVNVVNNYLYGQSGSVYVGRWCLGLKTMLLFAAFIYLTGKNNIHRWIYILFGLSIIFFSNIIRIVVLFVYVQYNYDENLTSLNHIAYNIVIYIIIFILWVIWYEKYSVKKLVNNAEN